MASPYPSLANIAVLRIVLVTYHRKRFADTSRGESVLRTVTFIGKRNEVEVKGKNKHKIMWLAARS